MKYLSREDQSLSKTVLVVKKISFSHGVYNRIKLNEP